MRGPKSTMSQNAAAVAITAALLLAACGEGSPAPRGDAGADTGAVDATRDGPTDAQPADGNDALAVLSINPSVGPVAGGTPVEVTGRGFADQAQVTFGDRPGTGLVLVSPFKLRVSTPAAVAAGMVAVTVTNTDGASATLDDGFEYRAAEPTAVDLCILQGPAATETQPSVASEPIFGRVWEQGCTEGSKRCEAVIGQLGLGPVTADPSSSPGAFSWTATTYNPAHTSDDYDEYLATLTAAAEGTYAYAYRFSIDGGSSWTYCDLDGSGNGFQPAQMGRLTVAASALSVGWCALQWPATTNSQPGQATEEIFGRVFVAGCTEGAAQCQAVSAELGHGPAGTDPVSAPALFSWVAASYNAGHTGDDNDEYRATLTVASAGSHSYAYRFSVDSGSSWTYCDLDGSSNGFAAAQMGRLSVGTPQVDWCGLVHPAQTATAPGVASEPVYGQVYVAGCSDGAARCDGVTAQLGHGDPAVDPTTSPGSYTWVDATYNAGHTGDDNDEYLASIAPTAAGAFGYAYRVSLDDGDSWTYCDLDGSGNGFDLAQLGQLTVSQPVAGIQWCRLQWPAATQAAPGAASEPIFGRVYLPGCTDGASQCASITAQIGYGDPAVDASIDPGAYAWVDATYNAAHTADDNDEYLASLTVASAGSYAYAYRFSNDSGASWTYCDLGGSQDGYQSAEAGQLTVAAAALTIDWCKLQWPAATSTTPSVATEPIYGRVHVPGCTGGSAQCLQVTAQLGFGSPGISPATAPESYVWTDAAYNAGHTSSDNDEYAASITPPASGSYSYAYRFSVDGGSSWSYCDLDSSLNGLQTDQLGALTVEPPKVKACRLQHPSQTSTVPGVASEAIYGRAEVAGCTDGAARCASLISQLGYGSPTVDPSADPSSYTWVDGGYNAGHTSDDEDEHSATLQPAVAGAFAYAYRFSTDNGGSWTYCDLDDSTPFSTTELGVLTAAVRAIDWCKLQYPATVTVDAGTSTGPIYGRVHVPGCTGGSTTCHGLRAELGHGPSGADPSTSPGSYTWTAATLNAGHTGSDNDEYQAEITPAQAGSYGYVFRFSGDNGASWSYCDTTGSPFAAADVGLLTVQ